MGAARRVPAGRTDRDHGCGVARRRASGVVTPPEEDEIMAARRRAKRRRRVRPKSVEAQQLLTYPVGVLIRDMDNHVYYLSLAQLGEFRRTDLEVSSVLSQMDAHPALLGLKNAWL